MKILRKLILTSATLVGVLYYAGQEAIAQNAETLQAAKELVVLISGSVTSDLTTKMTTRVWPPVESALRAENPKINSVTISELRTEFERLIVDSLSEAMNDAPTLYARHFTAQEIREVVAFYRTPAGAKTLKVMPQVTEEFLATITPRLQGLQEKVNLAFLNILQKRGFYAQ